jgi:hypothetical protein
MINIQLRKKQFSQMEEFQITYVDPSSLKRLSATPNFLSKDCA